MHGQLSMQRDMWQTSGKKRGEVGWQAFYKQDLEGKEAIDDSKGRILERTGRKKAERRNPCVHSRSLRPREKVFLTTQLFYVKEVVLRQKGVGLAVKTNTTFKVEFPIDR